MDASVPIQKHPKLICKANRGEEGYYFIALGNKIISVGKDPTHAFKIFFMAHWVFNVPYHMNLKGFFNFIESKIFIFKEKNNPTEKIENLYKKLK